MITNASFSNRPGRNGFFVCGKWRTAEGTGILPKKRVCAGHVRIAGRWGPAGGTGLRPKEMAKGMGMYGSRDAKREDFERIAAFPGDRREAFFMYPKGSYPFSAEMLYEVASKRLIPTVVLRDGEIVAYANAYDLAEGESCWIGNVIVSPKHRGQGAGKFLVETMIRRARDELGVREVRLVCHNVNTGALLLYHKLGFRPFGLKTVTDHENREIAGILMKYRIPG